MKRSLPTRRKVVGGLVAAAGLASMRPVKSQSGAIRIGCISTMTGSLVDVGRPHVQGPKMAVNQINQAGGIGGRQLELILRDTKFSASDAVGIIREFAGDGIN